MKSILVARWLVTNKMINPICDLIGDSVDYSVQNLIFSSIENPVKNLAGSLVGNSALKLIKKINGKV